MRLSAALSFYDRLTGCSPVSTAEGALNDARRPFVSSSLVVPLLLVLVACGAVLYYGSKLANAIEESAASNARVHGRLTAGEIIGFLGREQERLQAFVIEKEPAIREILAYPDNWPAIDAVQTSLRRMFRGALAFTVTGTDGLPMFEDFDGLVGPVCQASMRDYAQSLDKKLVEVEIPPVHPVPGAYHFDLISPWKLESGESGLFFVSMSPGRLAELLDAAERASGTRMLLVSREDPTLIEVSSAGGRDVLGEDFRLLRREMEPGYSSEPVPGTSWRLVVIPDTAQLADAVSDVYMRVALLVVSLLLISIVLLLFIRRAEQRNSSLFLRSLQSSVSRQRAILQSMVDGMVTIESRGKIHHVNNAVTRLFGYDPGELIGSNVRMLMPEPDRSAHDGYLQNYLTTGESKILGVGRKVTAQHKNGKLFPVMLTLGESVEADEHIFVGILHDMSDYDEAQRKIVSQALAIERSSQELEEIGQVASKDLQLPLQRIASLGASLESDAEVSLSGTGKAQLKTLTDDARNVSELVKGLVKYTRVERESPARPVQLDAVLDDVRNDLAAAIATAGAQLTVEPLGPVLGNKTQIRQLFWNLIENALKFRDLNRDCEIRVSLAGTDVAPSGTQQPQVVVSVADNGIGIPADQQDKIFEAFHRLYPRDRYPGVGLGLSFCRRIVKGMGGSITVSSEVGEGSTFLVSLPKAD